MGKYINKIKDALAKDFRIVTNWFYENLMVFILKNIISCILVETANETFSFKDVWYNNRKKDNILGITIDNKLNFDSHIKRCVKNLVKSKISSQEYQHF